MKIPSKYTDEELILGLHLVPGIGNETIRHFVKDGNFKMQLSYLSQIQLANLEKFDWVELDKMLKNISDLGIKYVTFLNKSYPKLLLNISDYPVVLFYLGDISILCKPCVSIVGTRKMSSYGKSCIERFTDSFVQDGWTIVSGMAFGVDAHAHKMTLKNKGKTVAVLGSGVDVPSPVTNEKLYHEILDNGGLVVSEQVPGTVPMPAFFPMRNRIISGLSKGVIVIEADEKSGSLITARCAFDQNRDVFAIPGDITYSRSRGTNKIIKDGIAKLITSPEDVLVEFGYVKKENSNQGPMKFDSELEQQIYQILVLGSSTIDEISLKLGQNVATVNQILTMMELKGMVTTVDSKYCICL